MFRNAFMLAALSAVALVSPAQNQSVTLVSGTSGFIEIPPSPTLVPQGGITFEAWVTYDETTLTTGWVWPTIARKNISAQSEDWMMRVDAAQTANRNLKWQVRTTNGNASVIRAFQAQELATWTHVAGTYDGTMLRIFINGTEMVATPATGMMVDTGNTLRIGKGDDAGAVTETWNGQLDEVRLWPFARSSAEILATMGQEIVALPPGASSWNLNGSYLDSSGSNHGIGMGMIGFNSNTLTLSPYPLSGGTIYGTASSSCTTPIDATFGSLPTIGNGSFALVCTGAPANAAGLLAISGANLVNPVNVFGVDVWIDTASPSAFPLLPVFADGLGVARFPIGLPNNTALLGLFAYAQWAWSDPSCGPGGITGSSALQLTFLP